MKSRWRSYLLFGVVGLAIFAVIALSRGLFSGAAYDEVWRILSDALFVPGVLLAGFGGLSWVSSLGGYDIFGYGVTTIKSHFARIKERPETYYDYRQRKDSVRRPWLKEALLTGGGFLILALVVTLVYLH